MPTATAALPSVVDDALHARDFIGLRDALKNWQPPDVANLISVLPVEDQAVVFRILPRKLAALWLLVPDPAGEASKSDGSG